MNTPRIGETKLFTMKLLKLLAMQKNNYEHTSILALFNGGNIKCPQLQQKFDFLILFTYLA